MSGLSVLGSNYNLGCQFAIRSGGHTPWAGASNINAGITIDMSSINQVTVSADKSYTSVGPGNRWVDVYMKLDALGLAVPGGRVSTVGVGGLVTGGEYILYTRYLHDLNGSRRNFVLFSSLWFCLRCCTDLRGKLYFTSGMQNA